MIKAEIRAPVKRDRSVRRPARHAFGRLPRLARARKRNAPALRPGRLN
jgi:hypothetical protein